MHRKFIFVLLAAVIIAMAGCGGGGGSATDPPAVVPPVTTPASYAGTWSVPSIYLPLDQLMIGSGGEVFVNGETPLTQMSSLRAVNYPTRIGTCDATGIIEFSGSWTLDGVLYRISGSGLANPGSGGISVYVTIVEAGSIVLQNSSHQGNRSSSNPPAVPTFPTDDNSIDIPPPPPL